MPRGKYTNHKGRSRRFTSAEELEEQRRQDERNRQRRREKGIESGEEEEEEEKEGSGSSDEETDSDEGPTKTKGVENLIEVENPNRAQRKPKKTAAVVTDPEAVPKPELSRREREEIEKQRASAHYHKLHAEGKTAQARADLARLAIVKQQREEAAKRREVERQEKEAAKQSKTAEVKRALGKKTT